VKPVRIFSTSATVVALLLVVATAVGWNIQTNDLIMVPSPALSIDSRIAVAGHPRDTHRGSIYITFVDEPQSNLVTRFYYEHFDPDATIVPLQLYYPSGIPSPQQQQQMSIKDMLDSKQQAQIAALGELGYVFPEQEVAVSSIITTSLAQGKLHENDVILQVNGHKVKTPQQLRTEVQRVHPGAPISLLVNRTAASGATHTLRVTFPTVLNPSTGKAAIGIYSMVAYSSVPKIPYKITINTGDIGGPSAGLMITLAILNRFSGTDLTHGHRIAGTGTIDVDGTVGPIGGVKQKVLGARAAHAEYFLVPQDNYAEAKPYARGITLVPVSTLDDALAFLKQLK
jgi:PDZ domain-containing protein